LIEKIYQTLQKAFPHISKHLAVHEKYSTAQCIFNSLFGVYFRDLMENCQLCFTKNDNGFSYPGNVASNGSLDRVIVIDGTFLVT